ncbi:MAG: glycosyltransferase family 2 protein [bacterium]|nr:glycosyltransferase family 2 protein [bacterium]MDT8394985.1 glycosyltransferase family 2 protein [bacterium]
MAFMPGSRKLTTALANHLSGLRFDPLAQPERDEVWPRVTVITPSCNQARYLERTIISIHNQGYPNLEHIVIDGGSTDGSVDILRKYEKRFAYWRSEPDRGQSDAINLGAAKATGRYMMWLNSDDLLMPCALNRMVEAFRSNPGADLVYGDQVEVDSTDKVIKKVLTSGFDIRDFIYEINIIIHQQSALWTTEIFHRVGGLQLFRYAMDYDLMYRMYDAGAVFVHIPGFLSGFRVHEGSLTGSGEVARRRGSEINVSFRSFTGRDPNGWDRAVRRPFYKIRRLMQNPRALAAALEHRLGRMFLERGEKR